MDCGPRAARDIPATVLVAGDFYILILFPFHSSPQPSFRNLFFVELQGQEESFAGTLIKYLGVNVVFIP